MDQYIVYASAVIVLATFVFLVVYQQPEILVIGTVVWLIVVGMPWNLVATEAAQEKFEKEHDARIVECIAKTSDPEWCLANAK